MVRLPQDQILLELKPLTVELLPAVVELDRLCFGNLWSLEGYERELRSINSDLLTLSCLDSFVKGSGSKVDKGVLVGLGCLWAILEEAHITLVAVHPEYQHQGLGQLLMYALLREAWRRGLERATLELGANNLAALSLYQKFGFAVAGRRRNYYPQTGEDGLIMWRSGLNSPTFPDELAHWQQQVGSRLRETGPYSVIDQL
ncbi:MAG: ribosomal protein S18-alanine N-acetyltransferase [Hormoscilla sp. GM102CHS1]|nr:ribosomal protein S18-alanine N-acetyltransferase [Hormoscilla sp. GM102CHS1]